MLNEMKAMFRDLGQQLPSWMGWFIGAAIVGGFLLFIPLLFRIIGVNV